MVTRAESPSDPLAEQLRELGAEVVLQPAIRILSPADWGPVDAAIARLHEYDWLVFSSSNGVRFLLDRLKGAGVFASADKIAPTPFPRVAAIGSGTAEELVRYGVRVDLVPEEYRAEALANALTKKGISPICRDQPSVGEKGDRSNLPRPTSGRCPPAGCCAQIGPVPFFPPRALRINWTYPLFPGDSC